MLEYAVRPYQTPNSQGKIIIPSTPSATAERATLTWGAQATMPTPTATGGVTCCSDVLDEQSRTGEVVRIYGDAADGDQSYVDVFRSNTLKLSKKSADQCQGLFDQYLSVEFAPFEDPNWQPDTGGEMGDSNCTAQWKLNNNTAAAA